MPFLNKKFDEALSHTKKETLMYLAPYFRQKIEKMDIIHRGFARFASNPQFVQNR